MAVACRNCKHWSGDGRFSGGEVPKIENREDEELFQPDRCLTSPVSRSRWSPVDGIIEEWRGYAHVGEINNNPLVDCPLFEPLEVPREEGRSIEETISRSRG